MNEYFPGFEPDFDVRQELRFIGGMPDLHQFDYVFISCSGGKDSHAMAFVLAELAEMQQYNKSKMELIYANTGLEWHDTFEQVKRIGTALGIKAIEVLPKYKLLDNVRRRWAKFNGLEWGDAEQSRAEQSRAEQSRAEQSRAEQSRGLQPPRRKNGSMASPFPNFAQRFCTSDHKRTPIGQYVRSRLQELCFAEVRGNNFQSSNIFDKNLGGGGKIIDHSPALLQNFVLHGENKSQCKNMFVNPFPQNSIRYCTGEQKSNAMKERMRKSKPKEDD